MHIHNNMHYSFIMDGPGNGIPYEDARLRMYFGKYRGISAWWGESWASAITPRVTESLQQINVTDKPAIKCIFIIINNNYQCNIFKCENI